MATPARTAAVRVCARGAEIAYVLKGYGRSSETFITNEIRLLERLGLPLRIYSIKKLDTQPAEGAPVTFLPQAARLPRQVSWLRANLRRFLPSHWRLLRRRPAAYLAALAETVRMSFAYRSSAWGPPRTVFLKEFLRAGFIADSVLNSGGRVRHLHAHFCHGVTTAAMLASRLCGIPFSFTAHAKDIYQHKQNPGDLLKRKMRRAEFVVTCTEANRRHLLRVCPDGPPVHTIYHGIDVTAFAPPARAARRGGDTPVILSVGRLVEKKGFDCLVRACRILKDRGWDFACRIVGGEDSAAPALRGLIAELGLAGVVTIHDPVPPERLRLIYGEAAVFVLPCQVSENGDRDGIPNVLAEAMAMQLPVVSTNISGIPELVENTRDGLLVPARDPQAVANAIETLLGNPEYARRLAAAARARICEMFDSQRNTLALRALLAARLEAR